MKSPAIVLAAALLALSGALVVYRILFLNYPALPTASGEAWSLTLNLVLKGEAGKEIKAVVGLPQDGNGHMVSDERIESGLLRFNLLQEGAQRSGFWTGSSSNNEEEFISYHATMLPSAQPRRNEPTPVLPPYPAQLTPAERALFDRLATSWATLTPTARLTAVLAAQQGDWGQAPMPLDDLSAWKAAHEKHGATLTLLALLHAALLPAHEAEGLHLAVGMTPNTVVWVEVWTGHAWVRLDPTLGRRFPTGAKLLVLTHDGVPAIRLSHATLSEVSWGLERATVAKWRVLYERVRSSKQFLDRWSLFHLPDKFQETFRILLLVPIGALMICVLRNVIGFPTFGIFMPVLMALAFRSTGLVYGLGIFAGVVLVGYLVRRWIERLRLMLVPRLSLVLTLVVGLFTVIALIGSHQNQREMMAVGLIPFVILTMTIERLFVILEEAGSGEALRAAAGSAAVAAITYEILHWDTLQLAFFVYPELLLAVAAAQVLIGRYTGYRLFELLRFRVLGQTP